MSSRVTFLFAMAVLGLVGCSSAPPPPAPARGPTSVAAPFEKSWNAVIDLVAERNIPIKTVDKASGLLVAEQVRLGEADAEYADCGTSFGKRQAPTSANWNVLVRSDGARSTVRVTVQFVRTGLPRGNWTGLVTENCATRNTFETTIEQQVKAKAEIGTR
jgi:hypothetical protein